MKEINAAFGLAIKSLWHRKIATIFTVLSISISVALFIGVNKTRESTRDAFSGAISKVDLIVGPRTGTLSLLLYSVFHVGSPNHNLSMKAVEYAKSQPEVEWVVPFSLGDGFSGYPVVGTTPDFFSRYKVGFGESLSFASGVSFKADDEVVIGHEVGQRLGLKVGDSIVLSHGHTDEGDGFEKHNDHPFKIVGVIKLTGTPIDRSVYCSLLGMAAIHEEPSEQGASSHVVKDHDEHDEQDHHEHETEQHDVKHDIHDHEDHIKVSEVSGFFVGAKNRMESLNLQRRLNDYADESLLAVLPGMAMAELWKNLELFETAMSFMSLFVIAAGLTGLFVSLYIMSHYRKREIMILRAVGAGPMSIFVMLVGEAIALVCMGVGFGIGLMYVGILISRPFIEQKFSVKLPMSHLNLYDFYFVGMMLIVGCIVGLLASWNSYRQALHEGLGTKY